MIGRKTQFDETYLTGRVVYRDNLTEADSGPDDNSIPEIRLDVSDSIKTQRPYFKDSESGKLVKYDAGNRIMQRASAGRAYNGHLELFVWFTVPCDAGDEGVCIDNGAGLIDGVLADTDERCHATLRVWLWGGESNVDPVTGTLPDQDDINEDLSSSSLSSGFGRWCLVHEQSVVTDTLIKLAQVPANRYRVTLDYISPGAEVDILEQHTE